MSEIIDETKQTEKKKNVFSTIGAFLKKHIKLIVVLMTLW